TSANGPNEGTATLMNRNEPPQIAPNSSSSSAVRQSRPAACGTCFMPEVLQYAPRAGAYSIEPQWPARNTRPAGTRLHPFFARRGPRCNPPPRMPAMPLLRLRITGTEDDARAISDLLLGLDGIEHVEETDDLMPHMDDDDSSSAGLSDDIGPGIHELEVEVGNESTAQKVRDAVQELALELDVFVEYETDEG